MLKTGALKKILGILILTAAGPLRAQAPISDADFAASLEAGSQKILVEATNGSRLRQAINKLGLLQTQIQLASLQETAARPIGFVRYKRAPGPTCRWPGPDGTCFSREYTFIPIVAYHAKDLFGYHGKAVEALGNSSQYAKTVLDELIAQSKEPAYSDKERAAFEGMALGLNITALKLIDDTIRLQETHARFVQQISGMSGDVEVPNFDATYKPLMDNSRSLMDAYGEAVEKVAAGVKKLAAAYGGGEDGGLAPYLKTSLDALNEPKTTFLVMRAVAGKEKGIEDLAARAAQVAGNWNPAEWRVLWLKQPDKDARSIDFLKKVFGDDAGAAAVSLSWGSGEERSVVKRYQPGDIADEVQILGAFAEAGPK
ncbi:MAG: hypothetical protein A3G41_03535 [Elusimicrobia bacterium RIFCSPLOWO2_12_FULL_59_9]|nr:MAG: hypothetical protein A3G41_03535 [Elusimicrobia bacterium RIFCSPLOWO2_12_FULL_59_9]